MRPFTDRYMIATIFLSLYDQLVILSLEHLSRLAFNPVDIGLCDSMEYIV